MTRPTPPAASRGPMEWEQEVGGEGARGFGWLLIIGGVLGLLVALNMDTSIQTWGGDRVHSLSLADERQTWLIVSSVALLAGLALLGVGYSARRTVRHTDPPAGMGRPAYVPTSGDVGPPDDAPAVTKCAACGIPLTARQASRFRGLDWCQVHYREMVG